jgi:predicted ATPase/DNA-binding SARP family transcriptional activator
VSQLKLSLLGPPRVEWDGHEVVLSLRRGLALLAYISLTDRLHRREELCALLWPDVDERDARSRLRHTLHRTGELVGHSLFDAEGDAVGLANDIDVWLDTWRLERALPDRRIRQEQVRELREVAASYRGDFLSGFTIPDSPTWDDWQFLEREHFRQLAGQLFRTLAEEELAAGEWEIGVSHARQWLSLDHMHEPAHRLLMQLYAASGQHAAALRQYEQCVRTLQSELGVEPESETEALHQSIRARRFTVQAATASADIPPVAQRASPKTVPTELAPSSPGRAGGHNIPTGLARYIGRESERDSVMDLLERTALLTLTGPGGVGKTRFAIELASRVAEEIRREVRFVELGSLTDPARVPATVAAVLGVADAAARPTVDTLIRALQGRRPLIVLDSCEHVIDACSDLVEALLHGCEGVSVLATSREPLGLSWEAVWPVAPLDVPDEISAGRVEAIAAVESVQLFVDRARMLRPSFTLGEANAADVAEICRRLDGIPLAIELAAVRLRILSPRQILERLDDRFHLLTGGSRAMPARQRTLEATIDWSHHLLTEAEQVLFRRLAVFAGGWTLEAAEEVCAELKEDGPGILDLLASLVDKSLVTVDVRTATPRYGLLDTIRAFALNRLKASDDEAATRARHQTWCFDLLREASYPLWGPEQVIWMARLDNEIDNIRAALDWCEQSPETVSEALEQCTFSLYRYWDVRGLASEGRSRLSTLLALAPDHARPGGVAQSEAFLAHFYLTGGLAQEARDRAVAAAEKARDADDPWALIHTLMVSMIVHGLLHDFDRIPSLCGEGLEVARIIGHPFGTAPWNYWLGEVACMEGRLDEGERLLQECRDFVATIGDTRELSTVIFVQGHAALLRGDLPRALCLIQETLKERYASRDAQVVPHCLDALGWVASALADSDGAARLLGAGQAAADRAGVILLPVWQADRDRASTETRSRLGEQRFQELLGEGRALTLDQAVELALQPYETEPPA